MPDTIPAGVVAFNLVNHGQEIHHAQLLKLEDGKTMDDLSAAMKEHGPPPSWMKHVGGPNPGGSRPDDLGRERPHAGQLRGHLLHSEPRRSARM